MKRGGGMEKYNQERWVSVTEIAAHLGVNKDTVHKWIKNNNIPAHRVGKLWKFKISQVDEWIKNGKAAEK
jgi:excisionase family DNA binding protein